MGLYEKYSSKTAISNKLTSKNSETDPTTKSIGKYNTAQRMENLGRKNKGSQKVWDFYLSKDKQAEVIKEETSTTEDILDFIDNVNRVFYGVAGGIYEGIKSYKYDNDSLLEGTVDVGQAVWKGLTREEKKTSRDIFRVIAPEALKEIENETDVELFWGIEADAMSVPLFVADMALDPISYIPFGAPAKLIGKSLSKAGRGGKVVATKILGPEKVAKITASAEDFLLTKVWPKVNIKKVFQNTSKKTYQKLPDGTEVVKNIKVDASDLLEDFLQAVEGSDTKAFKAGKKVASTGEKKGLLIKVQNMISEDKSNVLGNWMGKMNDEGIDAFGKLYAKELGFSVSDATKLKSANDIIDEIVSYGPIKNLSKVEIDKLSDLKSGLSDIVNGVKESSAKQVTKMILEKRGFKKFASKIALAERDSGVAYAKSRLKLSKDLWSETTKQIKSNIDTLQKGLKSKIKLTNKVLSMEVDSVVGAVKNLDEDLGKLINITSQETALVTKNSLTNLKDKIAGLNKYQLDLTKGMTKKPFASNAPLQRIYSLIRNLEIDIGKQQAGVARTTMSGLSKQFKSSIKTINKEIDLFKKLKSKEFKNIPKGFKVAKDVQDSILKDHREKLADLIKDKSEIDKFFRGEIAAKEIAINKTTKMANTRAKKYYKAFNSLNSAKNHQKLIKKFKSQKDEIFEKGLKDLDKELHEPARKIRAILDDYAVKLSFGDNPILKGTSPLYAPRMIQKEFIDKVSQTVPQFRSSKGFKIKRKIEKFDDFKKWANDNNIKIETDAVAMTMDYIKKAELSYAKHNIEQQLIKRFNVKNASDLPLGIKNSLQYIYTEGGNSLNNPIMRMVSNNYGKVLNTVKASLTVMNPAFHGRNVLGFPFLASTTAGMKHGWNPANYADAFMLKLGKKGVIKSGKFKYTYDQIREAAENSGYFGASFTRGDIKTSANLVLNRYKATKQPIKYWAGKVFKMSMHTEDLGRYGALVANLKSGKNIDEAIKAAKNAMFDYNLLNSPMDKALQGVFGFYTFSRRNLPAQFMAVANEPKQYAVLSRALNRISNREELTEEELSLLNGFEKETFKIFGDSIDSVREFKTLGFFPQEEAYQTLNAVTSGSIKEILGGRINPLLGSFLDWYYGKDSFYGTDIGNSLSPKYSNVIPEALWEPLGLTPKLKDKYRGGEVVGKETVLYGDTDTIFAIRKNPITSRFLSDLANFVTSIKEGKTQQGLERYLTGVRSTDLDVKGRKFIQNINKEKALLEKAKEKGVKVFERPYIPKPQRSK